MAILIKIVLSTHFIDDFAPPKNDLLQFIHCDVKTTTIYRRTDCGFGKNEHAREEDI
jgi:hypothetical protein